MRNEQGNEGKRIDGDGSTPGDKSSAQIIKAEGGSTIQNVIQAVIHLPPWAWIGGISILALTVLLVAGIFNIGPLQGLLPTPMAFAPASEGESLIIIADFDDRSGGKYQGVDPAQYIYERLVAQAEKDGLDVRIERLRQVVDDNTAKLTGETYIATLVLWGWYDALTITPRMERIRTVTTYRSTEEGQHLSLVDPEKVEFNIVTELPNQATYITLFTLGVDKFTRGNVDQALAYFYSSILDSSIFRRPPSEALFFRGNCYYVLGNYSEAAKDYAGAIESDPNSAIAYINLALLRASEGNLPRALELTTTAIKLDDPYKVFAYGARGAIYAQAGQWEQAAKDLTRAIEQDGTFALAYANRGLAYRELGYLDQAIADLEKAIDLDPSIAEAYYNRALVYVDGGKYLSAVADLTKALELEPEGIGDVPGLITVAYGFSTEEGDRLRTQSRNSARLAEFYHARGEAYASLGRIEKARNDYLKAAEIYSQLAKASPMEVCSWVLRTRSVLTEFSSFDKVVVNYTSILGIDPLYADAYYGRGVAHYRLEEYEQAVADFSKAIDLEPYSVDAYLGRGKAYAEMREYERAIADFTKAIKLQPNLAAAYSGRAEVYERTGSYEQAVADYSRAVEIDDGLLKVYFNRGVLYESLGRKKQAIADFDRVLKFHLCDDSYDELAYSQAEQHLRELQEE